MSRLNSSGTSVTGASGYTGGGLNKPYGLAIDSAGNVWTANYGGNSVSEFTNSGVALSGASGYNNGFYNQPISIAVDGSGNVWTANSADGTISELIGAASPVLTPLAANLVTARTSGTVINRP